MEEKAQKELTTALQKASDMEKRTKDIALERYRKKIADATSVSSYLHVDGLVAYLLN